ncbi:MAG: biopolymer transporter ExbD [Pseudomonadota bacterium]
MRLAKPPRSTRKEAIVPMINVVFLLLIFFLMTAQIAPPDPFEVVLPAAERETQAEGTLTLYVSAEGGLAYQDAQGEAAIAALSEAAITGGDQFLPVQIRADAGVEAVEIARLLRSLSEAGAQQITLLTAPP